MKLVLFRHGIAVDREDPSCPADPERTLTPKGIRRTTRAARGLAVLDVRPEGILTSDFARARQTAEIAADVLGFPREAIQTLVALRPEGSPRAVLQALRPWEGRCVLCAGHAPNLDLVLAEVLGLGGDLPAALGKAGAACVEVESPGAPGRLAWLLTPRALRALGGDPDDS